MENSGKNANLIFHHFSLIFIELFINLSMKHDLEYFFEDVNIDYTLRYL